MLSTAAGEVGVAENLGADGADELVRKCGHKLVVVPTTCLMVSTTNKINMINYSLLDSRTYSQLGTILCIYLTLSSF